MSAESTDNIEQLVQATAGSIIETEHPGGLEMNEWVFTNDKTNPHIRQQFHALMDAAFANVLGVMHAKDKDTGDIHTLLVMVESRGEEGVVTYPMAQLLKMEDMDRYLAPDGSGGYLDPAEDTDE